MTTIVWDGETLAVDSQETAGGIVISKTVNKLHLNIGGYDAIALCGECAAIHDLINHFKKPKENERKFGNCGGIAVKNGKAYEIYGETNAITAIKGKTANGSGFAIALGALYAGKNAIESIKIVKKLDIYTSGKINSYTIKKTKAKN